MTKPNNPPGLDTGNSLSNGLLFCAPFGTDNRDIVSGIVGVPLNNDPTGAVGGRYVADDGNGDSGWESNSTSDGGIYFDLPANIRTAIQGLTTYSIVVVNTLTQQDNGGVFAGIPGDDTAWVTPFYKLSLGRHSSTLRMRSIVKDDGATTYGDHQGPNTAAAFISTSGVRQSFGYATDGAGTDWFVDGTITAGATLGAQLDIDDGDLARMYIASRNEAAVSEGSTGITSLVLLYDRKLTAAEITAIDTDPFQMALPDGDSVAPVVSIAPAVDTVTGTAITVDATAADAVETTYNMYVAAVLDGVAKPSDAEIIAGTGGGIESSDKALAVANDTEASVVLTGLSPSTDYDIYTLFSDGTNDDSSAAKLDQQTAAAPDVTPPVVTPNAGADIVLRNGTYTDPGATAVDDVDGSVAATTTDTIDTSVVGTQRITYTAQDSASPPNVGTADRDVLVFGLTGQPGDLGNTTDFPGQVLFEFSSIFPDAVSYAFNGTLPPEVVFDDVNGTLTHVGTTGIASYGVGAVSGFSEANQGGLEDATDVFEIYISYEHTAVHEATPGNHTTLAGSPLRSFGPDIGGGPGDHIVGHQFGTFEIDQSTVPAGWIVEHREYPPGTGRYEGGLVRVSRPADALPGTYDIGLRYIDKTINTPAEFDWAYVVPVSELTGTVLFELEETWSSSPILTSIAAGSLAEELSVPVGKWIEVEPDNWAIDATGVLTMTGALPQTGQIRVVGPQGQEAEQSYTRQASGVISGASAFSFQASATAVGSGGSSAASSFGFQAAASIGGRGALAGTTNFALAAAGTIGSDATSSIAGAGAFSFQAMATIRAAAAPGSIAFGFAAFARIAGRGALSGNAAGLFLASATPSKKIAGGGSSAFRFFATASLADKRRALDPDRSQIAGNASQSWQIKPGDTLEYAIVWAPEIGEALVSSSSWAVQDNASALQILNPAVSLGVRTRHGQGFAAGEVTAAKLSVQDAEVGDVVRVTNTITTTTGQTITATQYVEVVSLYSNESPIAA